MRHNKKTIEAKFEEFKTCMEIILYHGNYTDNERLDNLKILHKNPSKAYIYCSIIRDAILNEYNSVKKEVIKTIKTNNEINGFETIIYSSTNSSNRVEILRMYGSKGSTYPTGKLIITFKDGNILDIHKEADKFLRDNYDINLNIDICINSRLKKCTGRFVTISGVSNNIDISRDLLLYENKDKILDTLYHELVHYALCSKYSDGYKDGQELFEAELKRLKITSNFS